MKKSTIWTSVFTLLMIMLVGCQNKTTVLDYLKELPTTIQPTVLQDYPTLLEVDSINNFVYKNTFYQDSMVRFTQTDENHTSPWRRQDVILFPSKDTIFLGLIENTTLKEDYISINYLTVKLLIKPDEEWKAPTERSFPFELQTRIENNKFLDAEFQKHKLVLRDNRSNYVVTLHLRNSKFETTDSIPENFGSDKFVVKDDINQNINDTAIIALDAIQKYWDETLVPILSNKNEIIKHIQFPFWSAYYFNGAGPYVDTMSVEKFDKAQIIEYQFPKGKEIANNENKLKICEENPYSELDRPAYSPIYMYEYTKDEKYILYLTEINGQFKIFGLIYETYGD